MDRTSKPCKHAAPFLLLACGLTGCAISETPRVSVTPDSTQPVEHTETQTTSVQLSVAEADDGVLSLSARRVTMCQAVEQRPMKQTKTVERSLEGSALTWTILGGVVSATATAAGVVSLAAPCALAGDEPCEPRQAQALGGVLLGVGAATLIPVIIAGVSAIDSTDESPAPPKVVTVGEPSACNVEPAAGLKLVVTADLDPQYREDVTTDDNGKAEVSLEGLKWRPRADSSLIRVVTAGGKGQAAHATLTAVSLNAYRRFSAEHAEAELRRSERARAQAAAEHEGLRQAVRKVDGWARSAIHVTWSVARRSETRCFNRVDFEVPCVGSGGEAVRREDKDTVIRQATVTNTGSLPIICSQSGGLFGEGKALASLAPGRSVRLPAVESPVLLALLTGLSGANAVGCGVSSAALKTKLADPLSPLIGTGELLLILLLDSDRFVYFSSEKGDAPAFEWDGSNAVVHSRTK